MHRRPSVAVAPLPALALPTREMNALLSSGSAPHTPTKRAEPLPLFAVNKNRYSTDSWNSSNFDGAEDMELEWKPEQIRFLNRTLDSLPAHLLTPFIGSVPPSNLLDKIARRVSEAKGDDWPHSIRATRAKLIDLGRIRAHEARDESGSDTIAEEGDGSDVPLQATTNIALKRPMRRQSSMDFIQPGKPPKDNGNITRLSRRLQKTDRLLTSPQKSHARSPSPVRRPLSLNPSTPSSSTLNSGLSSFQAGDRRSTSSMSSAASDQHILMAVRRIRRSDTFAGSSCLSRGLKRAPSFGSSRNSLESVAMSIDFDAKASDATSSDEEEKMRSRKAKRARRKIASPASGSPIISPRVIPPVGVQAVRPKVASNTATKRTKPPALSSADKALSSKPKANLQRNPSILGGELPAPQPNVEPPAVARASHRVRISRHDIFQPLDSPINSPMDISPYNITHIPPATPQSASVPRRVRPTAPLPRTSLARKISFGTLAEHKEESHGASGLGLGSAFQMH
ncbi:hypothetical protein BDY19DRAFT_991814 [Irpex rosettiformis]|uniref:Uncharacterized protein n=1 Tax=Irpex rosettiformis TaxID=378272 RepID=A0ACB8UAB6_9APHY|nr:hypothetical protein BDY19DRAFT_991814 [Irpex rosettiformis]